MIPFPAPDTGEALIGQFSTALDTVFGHRADLDELGTERGLPPHVLRDVMSAHPLRAYVPSRYGGFGDDIWVGQAVLEEASYHSLALGLMMGINGGLFIQPVAKYAEPDVAERIMRRFVEAPVMGGLSITEPGFGTDALSMRTSWRETEQGFRIAGTKHWAGLTGAADYWLVMARHRKDDDSLGNGIDLFICDQDDPAQHITVVEKYPALGLYSIPYGRTEFDIEVPSEHRLKGGPGGLRMMMDLLHRSRIQFPGMAIGFLRRMADEAVRHCDSRVVSGIALRGYDQVQARIARMHGQWACASALGLWAAENGSVAKDLSRQALAANAIKTVSTDYMQEAAHSLLQLVGAKGWSLAHPAGRGIVDSRPFQIFEGSNDVLYIQVGSKVGEEMRRAGRTNLREHLEADENLAPGVAQAAELLDLEIEERPRQRQVMELGAIVSRVFVLAAVADLGSRGFDEESIAAAVQTLTDDLAVATSRLRGRPFADVPAGGVPAHAWNACLRPVPDAESATAT